MCEQTLQPTENDRLRGLLFKAGICPTCGEEIVHHGNEPFATCKCGTMEWTDPLPLIHQLRDRIAELTLREF